MPRQQLAYEVADVSAAARSLREQLLKLERLPSHVELLNMLARTAGFRNFQHFSADAKPTAHVAAGSAAINRDLVEKVVRHFDSVGQMLRWPARESQAQLCLWVLWSRIPPRTTMTEHEISAFLNRWHVFGDHALLRRGLVDYGLVSRTVGGRQYLRIERSPPAELAVVLRTIGPEAALSTA